MADIPAPVPVGLADVEVSPECAVAGEPLDCYYVFYKSSGDVEKVEVLVDGQVISTCCNGPIKVVPTVLPTPGVQTIEVSAYGPVNSVTISIPFTFVQPGYIWHGLSATLDTSSPVAVKQGQNTKVVTEPYVQTYIALPFTWASPAADWALAGTSGSYTIYAYPAWPKPVCLDLLL